MEVRAIVITHNSEGVIGNCLDALREKARTVVIDNASSDGTVAEARKRSWVDVIANRENRGFAGGVNQGARSASEPYLLLLNPDTVLKDDLDPLVEACREHGLAAGCLTGPGGLPQSGFTVRAFPRPVDLVFECLGVNRLWPGNPAGRHYRCAGLDFTRPQLVEQPAGAFLMIRRDVFESLHGFDERFWPVWFEDVDFCRRAATDGFRVAYVPSVRAVHEGGHSVRNIPRSSQRVHWYGSLLRYAGKHYSSSSFRLVCLAVVAGSLVRLVTGFREQPGGELLKAHASVIRVAARGLLHGSAAMCRDVPFEEERAVRVRVSSGG